MFLFTFIPLPFTSAVLSLFFQSSTADLLDVYMIQQKRKKKVFFSCLFSSPFVSFIFHRRACCSDSSRYNTKLHIMYSIILYNIFTTDCCRIDLDPRSSGAHALSMHKPPARHFTVTVYCSVKPEHTYPD